MEKMNIGKLFFVSVWRRFLIDVWPHLSSFISDAMWQMNLRSSETMEAGPYPERPGEPDCSYYIRTGLCRFGPTCRFNHPPNRKLVWAAVFSDHKNYSNITTFSIRFLSRINERSWTEHPSLGRLWFLSCCYRNATELLHMLLFGLQLNIINYMYLTVLICWFSLCLLSNNVSKNWFTSKFKQNALNSPTELF